MKSDLQNLGLIYESMLEEKSWKGTAAAIGLAGLAALGAGHKIANNSDSNTSSQTAASHAGTTATSEDGKITTSTVKVQPSKTPMGRKHFLQKAKMQAFENLRNFLETDKLSGVTYTTELTPDGTLKLTATYDTDMAGLAGQAKRVMED